MFNIKGTFFSLMCILVAAVPSLAQSTAQQKAPVYTYVAQWAVPRAQWPDMTKADELDRPVLDKLVADGTLYGLRRLYQPDSPGGRAHARNLVYRSGRKATYSRRWK